MMDHDEPQMDKEQAIIDDTSPSTSVPHHQSPREATHLESPREVTHLQSPISTQSVQSLFSNLPINPAAPILLAIDTCTNRSSVALRDAHVLRAESSWESDRHHTAAVSAQIHKLMGSCGIAAAQIGAVAVAIGPGSFTGVRCGLAIAKGFASARNVPVIGVSAFDVIVMAQPNVNLPVLALVEIGRSRVAVQPYKRLEDRLEPDGPWRIQAWPDLAASIDAPVWVCGDLTAGLIALLRQNAIIAPAPLNLRRAGYLAEVGYARWNAGTTDDVLTLTPIYPPEKP